jgi:hypothetical protein
MGHILTKHLLNFSAETALSTLFCHDRVNYRRSRTITEFNRISAQQLRAELGELTITKCGVYRIRCQEGDDNACELWYHYC